MAASGESRLLDLPRELRDMIYEYALAEDEGLVLMERPTPDNSSRSFKGCRQSDHSVESNQLKYACRQLNRETKGLGLKLNDLTIGSGRVRDFASFLATCSASQQQCIRKVIVCDGLSSSTRNIWIEATDYLAPYRTSHPRIMFHIYNKGRPDRSGLGWMMEAGFILYGRHRHANHALLPPSIRRLSTRLDCGPLPSHVRIFPGTGPGHNIEPVFTEKNIQDWGEPQVRLCIEGMLKWQREGF
jgi:hypothetical protein